MEEHSKPIVPKTDEIIASGYDESAFAENYWLTPDVKGHRRIDRSAGSLLEYVRHLIFVGMLPENPRIVDIGAGAGGIVHQFRQAGFRCEGCEFSASGREIAKAQFNIDLLPCDLRDSLPYPNCTFDFAMCVGVLTMIPESHIIIAMRLTREILQYAGLAHLHVLNPRDVINEPHITRMESWRWGNQARKAGFVDVTSACPPQWFGIGMNRGEFSGLFQA